MEALVRDKFRRNAKARGVLVGTGRVKLVYTNAHEDRVWGVCGGEGQLPIVSSYSMRSIFLCIIVVALFAVGPVGVIVVAAVLAHAFRVDFSSRQRYVGQPAGRLNIDGKFFVSWPWGRRRVAGVCRRETRAPLMLRVSRAAAVLPHCFLTAAVVVVADSVLSYCSILISHRRLLRGVPRHKFTTR